MILKVVSLNLWWGGYLFPAILDFLKAQDADIVALQEVYNGVDPGLEDRYRSMVTLKQLNYPHSDFVQSFIHDSPAGMLPQGNAILSKFPITTKSSRFIVESEQSSFQDRPEEWPLQPRVLQYAGLKTPSGPVNFYNLHGVWDLDGDAYTPARQKMNDIILKEIQGKHNVILTGDTNATPANQFFRNLETQLNSVFGSELRTTFNMRHKELPGYATAAVDHMYVSPNIKVLSKQSPEVDISDHLPLVVTLDIT